MIRLKDLMLETDTIGLAEKFINITNELFLEIETQEELKLQSSYYFGMEVTTGEICEVRGQILEVLSENGKRIYKTRLLECDANYHTILLQTVNSQASSEKSKTEPLWAYGLKQSNASYAVIINSPAGVFNSEQLKTIAEISQKGYGIIKLTHAQRIVVLVKPEQLDKIEEMISKVGLRKGVLHHGVRNIRACAGALCKWSKNNDAVTIASEIDKKLYGFPAKFDIKVAVSDCMRNCSECYCSDIGFIGMDGAYRIVIGGRGSSIPFRGIELAPKVDKAKVVAFIEKFVNWYVLTANEGERLCKTLQRIGLEIFNSKPEEVKKEVKNTFDRLDMKEFRSGDGVSEAARMFEQYLRGLAVDSIRSKFQEVL